MKTKTKEKRNKGLIPVVILVTAIGCVLLFCIGATLWYILNAEEYYEEKAEKTENFCLEMQEAGHLLPVTEEIQTYSVETKEDGTMVLTIKDEDNFECICEMTPYDCQILDLYPNTNLNLKVCLSAVVTALLIVWIYLVIYSYRKERLIERAEELAARS